MHKIEIIVDGRKRVQKDLSAKQIDALLKTVDSLNLEAFVQEHLMKVVRQVADYYGVSHQAILLPSKKARIGEAKKMCYYILYHVMNRSDLDIASLFGVQSRTVVDDSHTISVHIKHYADTRAHWETLKKTLNL